MHPASLMGRVYNSYVLNADALAKAVRLAASTGLLIKR